MNVSKKPRKKSVSHPAKERTTDRLPSQAGNPEQNTNFDIDFDYVYKLTPHYQRVAVFYEYARHSRELTETIQRLRCAWRTPEADEILERLKILPAPQNFLPFCKEFPEKPFKDVVNFSPWESTPFGVSLPETRSLGDLFELRRALSHKGWIPFDSSGDEKFKALGETAGGPPITQHVISIPWCYTNAELKELIGELLPGLRPDDCPEPRKAGRTGRLHIGIKAMLNQLVAYRMELMGSTRYEAKNADGQCIYISEAGWMKAIKMARIRIESMMLRPFFQIHTTKTK